MDEIQQVPRLRRDQPQAVHGLQGRADGRRRDAVPRDAAGRRSTGC